MPGEKLTWIYKDILVLICITYEFLKLNNVQIKKGDKNLPFYKTLRWLFIFQIH
jgi:hypothetical protein